MFAQAASPLGVLTRINLDQLPIWRLELCSLGTSIGIGVRYLHGANSSVSFLSALDCISKGDEVQSIVKKGLPRASEAANKELLAESMKILFNADGLKAAVVDGLIALSGGLVEVYYRATAALDTGSEAHGEFEGWKWKVGV